MAKKPTIVTVPNVPTSINTNFKNLQDAFENTLSLNGDTPNQMTADLDMDGNDILNAGSLVIDGVDIIARIEELQEDTENLLETTLGVEGDLEEVTNSLTGGTSGQLLTKASSTDFDYTWTTPSSSGDMLKVVYDPANKAADAFSMDNMTEGTNTKILSSAERTKLSGIATGAQVNVGTNLSVTTSTTTLGLNSSTGTGATLPVATASIGGVMSAADKNKLDGIATGAQVNVATDLGITQTGTQATITSSTGTNAVIPSATTSAAGLLSGTDKNKLDGIATGANLYSHPTGDGNLHVPATGTGNNGKVLKAGASAGSASWQTLAKADVGLGNVDNTSDANKPVSTATQTALNLKANSSSLGALAFKAQAAVADIAATGTPGAGNFLRGDGSWSPASGGGGGTVTSVDISVPTGLSVSGGPITASGTFTITYAAGYQGYTSAEASKLSGIQAGAEVNVQSDWSAVSGDALILNKPTLGGAAALNVGTTSGTVAAGNDSRIVGAVQTSRSITAGTGLTGGGNLSADRSLALSTGSIASLLLADTAVQPSDLGDLAYLDAVGISDISATGTPGAGTFLRGDGTWSPASGGGGGTVTSVGLSAPTGFSVSGGPVTGSGTLTFTYAAGYVGYTTAEASKLAGIATGAQVNTVTSVASKTGAVTLAKGDVGLGNVDNTSDANKPVSTAQQTALNLKLTKAGDTGIGGFGSTVHARGNSSGQTITPVITTSNFQTLTNNGAFTLAAPADGQYTIAILVSNNSSGAGAMTATGFSKVHGAFATTANLKQLLTITVIGSTKILTIMDAS